MNQKTGLYAVIALLVIFGAYLITPIGRESNKANAPDGQTQVSEISYQGQEGKTAMELLKASHQVEATPFDFGDMVTSIDGVKPDSSQFWAFYVNGQASMVGADAYQTKNGDQITWKLDAK